MLLVQRMLLLMVSIPNGMEFYSRKAWESGEIKMFQFPTGWNSTLRSEARHYLRSVSIPNGMEFYAKVRYLNLRSARFNSQRDGILLYPNIVNIRSMKSFNSQRDGILPNIPLCVSIPLPGFNSQRDGILPTPAFRLRSSEVVSIPNGMEFY